MHRALLFVRGRWEPTYSSSSLRDIEKLVEQEAGNADEEIAYLYQGRTTALDRWHIMDEYCRIELKPAYGTLPHRVDDASECNMALSKVFPIFKDGFVHHWEEFLHYDTKEGPFLWVCTARCLDRNGEVYSMRGQIMELMSGISVQ